MTRRIILLAGLALATVGVAQPFDAHQTAPAESPLSASESMIPMRDGVRLYTQVYAPKPSSERLPIILLRTPYGTGALNPSRVAASLAHLVADGYIFVQQDIRGRFKSDGAFV